MYKPLVKWPQRSPDLTIINMFLWQPGRQVARATRFWKKAFNICGSLVWNWLYVYLMVSSDPPPPKKKFWITCAPVSYEGFLKRLRVPMSMSIILKTLKTRSQRHVKILVTIFLPEARQVEHQGWRCPRYSRGSTDLRFMLSLHRLGAFAQSRKALIIRSSVRPNVPARLPMNGLPWKLILRNLIEICHETPNFVKFGHKYSHSREDLITFYCGWWYKIALKALSSRETISDC